MCRGGLILHDRRLVLVINRRIRACLRRCRYRVRGNRATKQWPPAQLRGDGTSVALI
jgi:hypothetical protein